MEGFEESRRDRSVRVSNFATAVFCTTRFSSGGGLSAPSTAAA